jgi:dipeptidyl aminopeptidase/acylaminoacyl peptidase
VRYPSRIIATLAFATLGVLPSNAASPAEPASFPSNEDLRHLRHLDDPQLSPDGTKALLAVQDATADGGRSHIWLIDVAGGAPRQLTFSGTAAQDGERSARWMPDGRSVLFLAHRGEHTALQQLPLDGGEARPLELKVRPVVDASKDADALPPSTTAESAAAADELPVDVSDYAVSPDGAWIAFLARDPETPGEKKQKDAKADAEWVDHDRHGTRLYLDAIATARITALPVPQDVRGIDWSPDGKRLVIVTEPANHAADLGPARSTWIVDVSSPERPTRVDAVPATVSDVLWSGDGGSLVYLAQARRDAPPGYNDLYALALESGRTANLTDGLDASLDEGSMPLADGSVLQRIDRGLEVTAEVLRAGTLATTRVPLPLPTLLGLSTNATRSGFLWLAAGGGQPPTLLHSQDLRTPPTVLPTPAVATDPRRIVVPKHIHWQSDGRTIDGLLYLPPAATTQAVPLVVAVHGGPSELYSDDFAPFTNFLVGQGWAVLRTNPRGSTGRGAAFVAANKNDLGGGDYRDIMAGVDFVLKTERIDAARLALIGYSYGGEMAAFVAGRTRRFKAIVSAAPVIDQYSEYGTEDDSWYDRWYFGKPWERPADAWRQSPLATAGKVTTPLLLLQGQADTVDPPGQAQEMYRALRQAGAPVELVIYPRVDHGALAAAIYGTASAEPWHGFDARRRIVTFIAKAFGAKP